MLLNLFRLTLSLLALTLVLACQPSQRFNSAKNPATTYAVIEEELTPTVSKKEVRSKSGAFYQALPKKIKNAQAEILLGHVKMDKTKISYDPATRELKVSGQAAILDENHKEIGSNEFNLSAVHATDDQVFYLKAEKNSKANSQEKPVVRAQVTCLSVDNKDQVDCSKSVVDFFIAFRKKVYTEQMELADKKIKQPIAADTPVKKADPKPEVDDVIIIPIETPVAAVDDLQAEGAEDSIDGRFQGQAETVDLVTVFADDEAEEKAAVVVPVAPIKPLPPTKSVTPTSTPTTSTEPEVKVEEKKDKPLTKDLSQTKAGDVRQINQSLGFPDKGTLRNATSLLTKQLGLDTKAFFEVVAPASNRHYSTYEMADMIARMGKNLNLNSNRKLYVGNISQKNGGKLSPHLSHQIGLDADLAYPAGTADVKFPLVVQTSTRKFYPASFSVARTFELLKFSFMQPDIKVDRIFADRTIKKALCEYAKNQGEFSGKDKAVVQSLFENIDHVDGHGDHFHIRLKCSSYDPGCRQKIYAENKGCN